MSNNEIKERVVAVYNSLNNIEVKGQHNVTNLAGCMQILHDVVNAIVQNEKEVEPTNT